MPVYDRSRSTALHVVDEWADGFGWLAHPDETGHRVGHAVRTRADSEGGVWVLDPLDAPGLDDRLAALGEVVGVAVLSDYHARDAAAIAERYEVPVTVPAPLDRAADRVDGPVELVEGSLAGFDLQTVRPLHAWTETVAYREADGTLYVPDYLSGHEKFCVGGERVGMPTFSRLVPPRDPFECFAPERILFGHGEGVTTDARAALADALDGARRRFPRALVSNLPGEASAMLGALRD